MKVTNISKTKLEKLNTLTPEQVKLEYGLYVEITDGEDGLWDSGLYIEGETFIVYGSEGTSGYGRSATITVCRHTLEVLSVKTNEDFNGESDFADAKSFIDFINTLSLSNIGEYELTGEAAELEILEIIS